MTDVASQMQALDDFVTRARSQNERHHETHLRSLQGLSSVVKQSYASLSDRFITEQNRVRHLEGFVTSDGSALQASLPPLSSAIQVPLSELRQEITDAPLKEYSPTGETPQKTHYIYPTTLPRTEPHNQILAKLSRPSSSSSPSRNPPSPNKAIVYNDISSLSPSAPTCAPPIVEDEVKTIGLLSGESISMGPPPLKRQATMESKLPQKLGASTKAPKTTKVAAVVKLEGRENAVPGPGTGSVSGSGRRLRSSPLG